MSDISELLREVVGHDCEDEISIFRKEKVNCELFWKLDKELLLEMGKACDSAQLWLSAFVLLALLLTKFQYISSM